MTKYQILDLLQKFNIPYAAKGKSYVTRCPWCKGDSNLKDHNAEINVDTGTLYCFSEQKTYFIRDLLQLFGEIPPEQIKTAKEKIIKDAQHNTELSRVTRERHKFDDIKNDLLQKGFTVTGIYVYRNLLGEKEYEVIRFEKPAIDGGKPEKIPIPVDVDGYVGLRNGKRQIPYRLEQFLVTQSDENEIWLVEGEKCCDAVIANMPSSANIVCLGFRKASDFKKFETLFKDKKITIFQDNDKTGQTNTENLIEMLRSFAKEIVIVKFSEFQEGYDVADFLEDFGWNQLVERIEISEKWKPDENEKIEEIQKLIVEVIESRKLANEDWLCKDLIYQNSICLFDAQGGSGKSYLMLQMAISYVMQESFLIPEFVWDPARNRKILYITNIVENPAKIIANRVFKICEKYEIPPSMAREMVKNLVVTHKDHMLIADPKEFIRFTDTFIEIVDKIIREKIQIVVVDPASHFFLTDLNANERVPYIYETLTKTGATWIIVHHQSKASMFEKTENTSQRGASALRDNARLRITMKKRELPKGLVTDLYIEKANFSKYQNHHIFLSPDPPYMAADPRIYPHDEVSKMEKEFGKRWNGKKISSSNRSEEVIIYQDPNYPDSDFA